MRLEPRWLTDTTVLAIHPQQIARFGGAHGVRDQYVVLSALTMRVAPNQACEVEVARFLRERTS